MRVRGQGWAGLRRTYEAEGEDGQRADGVRQHAGPEHVHVLHGDDEVPEEVAAREPLDHARGAGVAPHTLLPGHVGALLIVEDDVEGGGVDGDALAQRHDMDVPVELLLGRERRVLDGEQPGREDGREVLVDGRVGDEGDEHLVNVQRQRGEPGVLSERRYGLREEGDRGDKIMHLVGSRGAQSQARALKAVAVARRRGGGGGEEEEDGKASYLKQMRAPMRWRQRQTLVKNE